MFSRSLFSRTARLHLTYRAATACQRSFTSSNILRTGDRPTHFTNILAGANFSAVQIKNVGPEGIHLEDGLIIPSSCLFIEGKIFLWNVPPAPWEGWKPEHFEVFDTIVPKPEVLLLGTGKRAVPPPPHIRQYLSSIGIQSDVMDTVRDPHLP